MCPSPALVTRNSIDHCLVLLTLHPIFNGSFAVLGVKVSACSERYIALGGFYTSSWFATWSQDIAAQCSGFSGPS